MIMPSMNTCDEAYDNHDFQIWNLLRPAHPFVSPKGSSCSYQLSSLLVLCCCMCQPHSLTFSGKKQIVFDLMSPVAARDSDETQPFDLATALEALETLKTPPPLGAPLPQMTPSPVAAACFSFSINHFFTQLCTCDSTDAIPCVNAYM